jgi:hypothetical protein
MRKIGVSKNNKRSTPTHKALNESEMIKRDVKKIFAEYKKVFINLSK